MSVSDSYKIFSVPGNDFDSVAIEIFRYQYNNCLIYGEYCKLLGIKEEDITRIEEIPFLPIQFFKKFDVVARSKTAQVTFTSSGTTGTTPSRHLVADVSLYEKSFLSCFELFYGSPRGYSFLALLPSYLERSGSSLVYMVDKLMSLSGNQRNGYYLYNYDELRQRLLENEDEGQKTILFGVSFALLDFCQENDLELKNTTVIETGGMKGRGKEITRQELHEIYKTKLGVSAIHSEYGMTELLSQAYSRGNGQYTCPPWMKILIRDSHDPFSYLPTSSSGCINVIDLANIFSCSFVETEDIGKKLDNGSFEVSGRYDKSEVRGCNLMF